MIGYVLVDGKAGGENFLQTALRANGMISVFQTEKAARQFRGALEEHCGMETKDLMSLRVKITMAPRKD